MSRDRNMKWLNDRRVIYARNPITDIPTESTDLYDYYENGTYECYSLFRSKAKITTYKSLKWHFLVLYYLNYDGIDGDDLSLEDDMSSVFKFIANKENGFVTFFIKQKILDSMIKEVFGTGDTPPRNRIRKVIFKPKSWSLTLSEKLSIVGKLIGRGKKITKEAIYGAMLDINNWGNKITISNIALALNCTTRTVHRNMCIDLKKEKQILNEKV